MMTAGKTEDKITLEGVRKIRRSGGSSVVTIPQHMLAATHFEESDDVKLEADANGDEIVITHAQDDE